MDDFPIALVLASQEEVYHNNNVLYRLVRPLPDGSGVKSTEKLVNVVPFRRVYTFYRLQEVLDFEQLLLARPLVLQPVLHFGRGLGNECGACYSDEPWVVMVNQTHPKILGRFQMGMDLAKQAIQRGQSVDMKFCLTKLIQRVYEEHLRQREAEEAEGWKRKFFTYFRFTEWEHADLIIRYHGAELKSRTQRERKYHQAFHKEWDFDDIGSHEILWNQVGEQDFPHRHNAPVSEDELRAVLPAWTINGVSPLQDIGDNLPQQNYSYAKAGRLYESFRKKKKLRPLNTPGDNLNEKVVHVHQGEESHSPPAIVHDFNVASEEQARSLSRARRTYMEEHDSESSPYDYYNGEADYSAHSNEFDTYLPPRNGGLYSNESVITDKNPNPAGLVHGRHVGAVQTHEMSPQNVQVNLHSNHLVNSKVIRKQDSDRSRGSTNADSGYSDGQRSRGGSYDCNDQTNLQSMSKYELKKSDQMSHNIDGGLVNPGFDYDVSEEDALERHKKFVANMLAEQGNDGLVNVHSQPDPYKGGTTEHFSHRPNPGVSYEGVQKAQGITESFI